MLKIAGAVLVIFSCSALGYSKSIHMTRRLQQLREIEKMVFLILGEITYRREALPEALGTVAYRLPEPLAGFLKEVSEAAGQYQGGVLSGNFQRKGKNISERHSAVSKGPGRIFAVGSISGISGYYHAEKYHYFVPGTVKKGDGKPAAGNACKAEAVPEHGSIGRNFSGNYAALKIMQGERCHGSEFIIQNRCSRHSGVCPVSDTEAQPEGGAGLSHQSDRSFAGVVLGAALYL